MATNVVSSTRRVVGTGRLFLVDCVLIASMAWSTSMRSASPTLTRITRCVPPLRSRPRRIGSGLFFVGTIAAAKSTSTPTINAIFHQRLLFKLFLQAGVLLGSFGHHARYCRARHLDLHVFGNLEVNDVGLNPLDRPVNPAGSQHTIALFQRGQHFLRLATLLVRRGDHQ